MLAFVLPQLDEKLEESEEAKKGSNHIFLQDCGCSISKTSHSDASKALPKILLGAGVLECRWVIYNDTS